jgi:hypothetical protein
MAGEWIKMRTNLMSDPRVSQLCDITDASKITIVGALYWLWAAADEHTDDGLMPGLSTKAIDRETGVKGFGAALVGIGWLVDSPEGVCLIRFEEHNGTSAKSRAMTAKRVSNYRGNAPVTPAPLQNFESALPREEKRREEKEVNQEQRSKTKTKAPASPSPELDLPDWVPADAFNAFAAMRKANKKPLTATAIPLAVATLGKLRAAGHDPRAVLEQSTLNSWQGLFEVKGQHPARASPAPQDLAAAQRASTEGARRRLFGDSDDGKTFDA